jgi:hypothetical protein
LGGENMDAEKRIIPIVEDDQGEGFKDPLDEYDLERLSDLEKRLKKEAERFAQMQHSQRFKK